MLSLSQKKRIEEIDALIESLREEKYSINPFAYLKDMSMKQFGEEFSENYILARVPNLISRHGAGHDMYSTKLGLIEVKSGRPPYKKTWTFNQLHPHECEHFLFVFYDTENASTEIFLVPSKDITNNNIFSISKQHSTNGECYSMSGTRKNILALQEYKINSWEELNNIV